MHKRHFSNLAIHSAVLSCISGLMFSVYPTYASHERPNIPKLAQSQSATRIPFGSNGRYTSEQINYFLDVALGNEYGSANATIKKWDRDIRIKVMGSPTPEDVRTLQAVITEINTLVHGITLQIDNTQPNVEIYFVPESKFSRYDPNYQPRNYGFFWNLWNKDTIYNSRVLISSVGITQKERSHLIREELTQALGLMKDSSKYPDSIFYQGWTDPTNYTEIDKALIQILYRPEIRPGMTKSQVLAVLKQLDIQKESSADCEPTDANPALNFSVEQFCTNP